MTSEKKRTANESKSRSEWLWVAVQIGLLAALIFAPRRPRLSIPLPLKALGALLCAVGLLVAAVAAFELRAKHSLTPLPSPRPKAELQTRGLYRYARHPIYSGALTWAAGVVFWSAALYPFAIFLALIAFFTAKAKHEERLLRNKSRAMRSIVEVRHAFFRCRGSDLATAVDGAERKCPDFSVNSLWSFEHINSQSLKICGSEIL